MTLILAMACLASGAAPAFADPSAGDWAKLRMCESSGDYAINTGNGYYGAYQFNLATWEWMGGTGLPSDASPAEQDYRALKLYRINGWAPWPACTKKLGLKNDADAKSGVIPPDPGFAPVPSTTTSAAPTTTTVKKKKKKTTGTPTATSPTTTSPKSSAPATTASSAPATTTPPPVTTTRPAAAAAAKKKSKTRDTASSAAVETPADGPPAAETPATSVPTAAPWPGRQLFPGEYSEELKIWQRQAARIGYDVVATGYFGPKTEYAAFDLQGRSGITVVDYIGPQTWSAAWAVSETTR